jgi:hypothetical protein
MRSSVRGASTTAPQPRRAAGPRAAPGARVRYADLIAWARAREVQWTDAPRALRLAETIHRSSRTGSP